MNDLIAGFQMTEELTSRHFPQREAIEGKPSESCDTPLRNLLPRVAGAALAVRWRQRGTFGERRKVESYKLIGAYGALRGEIFAPGRTYKDIMADEKQNTLLTLMQHEENALINADSNCKEAPWGDGKDCLSYNGLLNEITVENGVPEANIATDVGELITAHIDEQLDRCWQNGGHKLFILWGNKNGESCGYKHKTSQEQVPILCSRFMPAGTIIFGALVGPEGENAIDVDVLPQLPGDYENGIQGYCCTDLARTTTEPDVFPFMVSVYEVLRVHDLMCFAKSTGVLPVKGNDDE